MSAVAYRGNQSELARVYKEINARPPEYEFEPGLDRMRAAVELLGHPELAYRVVHVAGTNGKTSTARIAEALLRARGMRTGLLTSPPLTDPRDRIALDGQRIGPERFVEAWRELRPVVQIVDAESHDAGGRPLGLFEVWVLLGLTAFADAPVEVAVVEVGMGGAWDATNVVESEVQVVTPISLDHQRWLGDDVASIAAEKAGIIASRAVVARQRPEAMAALESAARQRGAQLFVEDRDFALIQTEPAAGGQDVTLRALGQVFGPAFLPLFGEHQAHNAALALAAVELALGQGPVDDAVPGRSPEARLGGRSGVDGAVPRRPGKARSEALAWEDDAGRGRFGEEDGPFPGRPGEDRVGGSAQAENAVPAPAREAGLVAEGLASVRSPGRLEVVHLSPPVIVDAAHNPAGAEALAEAIADGPFPRLVGLVGVLADKDAEAILGALEPVLVSVVVTRSASERALDPEALGEVAREVFGPDRVQVVDRLDQALAKAIELADEDTGGGPAASGTGVLATGSVTVAGEVSTLLGAGEPEAGDNRPRRPSAGADDGEAEADADGEADDIDPLDLIDPLGPVDELELSDQLGSSEAAPDRAATAETRAAGDPPLRPRQPEAAAEDGS
jgi:dihydrofolate synthase/folylpolyglutamate synthase